jgi:hypothetical protein
VTERTVLDVASPQQWEQWLEVNHDAVTEVWLRLFNKTAGDVPLSYAEAVEIALCFGWIDSLARGHDEVSRIQRFSPRKAKSAWSKSMSNGCNDSWPQGECASRANARSMPPRPTAAGLSTNRSAGRRWEAPRAIA